MKKLNSAIALVFVFSCVGSFLSAGENRPRDAEAVETDIYREEIDSRLKVRGLKDQLAQLRILQQAMEGVAKNDSDNTPIVVGMKFNGLHRERLRQYVKKLYTRREEIIDKRDVARNWETGFGAPAVIGMITGSVSAMFTVVGLLNSSWKAAAISGGVFLGAFVLTAIFLLLMDRKNKRANELEEKIASSYDEIQTAKNMLGKGHID